MRLGFFDEKIRYFKGYNHMKTNRLWFLCFLHNYIDVYILFDCFQLQHK